MKISLQAARVNAKMTQKQAAAVIGVCKETVSAWEKGKSYPDVVQARLLCETYGMELNDIFFAH